MYVSKRVVLSKNMSLWELLVEWDLCLTDQLQLFELRLQKVELFVHQLNAFLLLLLVSQGISQNFLPQADQLLNLRS